MEISGFVDQVLFVVVLYRRQPQESPPVQLLTSAEFPTASIFVYDNSPNSCPPPDGPIYVHDPLNSGVAKAYNEAHNYARTLKKEWIMLLDQDTIIDGSYMTSLASAVGAHPGSVLFAPILIDRDGMVSPFHWNGTSGKRISRVGRSLHLKNFRFQNSGLLVKTEAFEQAGGYDERIGLDFSDIAFGEKMGTITDHFIVVDHNLVHGFSETEKVSSDSALHRYNKFCSGAFAMGKAVGRRWPFYFRALARGLKLTIRYKDPAFIKTFFTS